jgi:hypothetical protein
MHFKVLQSAPCTFPNTEMPAANGMLIYVMMIDSCRISSCGGKQKCCHADPDISGRSTTTRNDKRVLEECARDPWSLSSQITIHRLRMTRDDEPTGDAIINYAVDSQRYLFTMEFS